MEENTQNFIASLRDLARFYETHPDLIAPIDTRLLVCLNSKQQIADYARKIGGCEKKYGDSYFSIIKRFGLIKLEFFVTRAQVCRSKITGVRTVPEKVIPAHDEPIVEWECTDTPLLKPSGLPQLEEAPVPIGMADDDLAF